MKAFRAAVWLLVTLVLSMGVTRVYAQCTNYASAMGECIASVNNHTEHGFTVTTPCEATTYPPTYTAPPDGGTWILAWGIWAGAPNTNALIAATLDDCPDSTFPVSTKNAAAQKANVGDPINASTGNKYIEEDDYPNAGWLTLSRFYNSAVSFPGAHVGPLWSHSFQSFLQITGSPATSIIAVRANGSEETFTKTGIAWTTDPDIDDTLTETDNAQGVATGYTLFVAGARHTETYSATGQLQTVTGDSGQGITLTYSTASTPTTIAPVAGLLITVTDPHGRQLNFVYNGASNITKVTLPDAATLNYGYDTSNDLTTVTYPDSKVRTYVYNETALVANSSVTGLTGIVDETNTRYANTTYNANSQATNTNFAGGYFNTTITYNSDGTSTVQYPLGATTSMGFTTLNGVNLVASNSAPCGPQCDQTWKSQSYDATGKPTSATDFNNNTTATTYNSVGLLTQQIDADGQSTQRTTNYTWNTTLRVPLTRTVLNASGTAVTSTQWVYNTTGQTLARCDIDPAVAPSYTCATTGSPPTGVRRWTYTYCTAVNGTNCPLIGLMLTATGPRTDVVQTTSYSYYLTSSSTSCGTPGAACYQPGDLHTVTDALGHITTIASYDGAGRITRITDANGVNTDMTYTPRGWLATRTVGGAETQFGYTAYGAIQTITDPDGVITTYGYDAAHRLVKITDALGNYVQYTLDAAGNKTAEQVFDSSGTVHKSLTRSFNTLGQLTSVIDGLNQTVFSASATGSYDANGNLITSTDALGIARQRSYDALNRLQTTLDNYNGTDAATKNTTTGYQYDSLDRLTQVTDPSSLITTYGYDGLSNAKSQTSPDTGSTARSFDAAGNVTSKTDARGVVSHYSYDALNRLTGVSYPAQPTLNIVYTYDQATPISGCPNNFNIGHLTTMTDASGTTSWCYTNQGDIREVRQVINSVVYLHGYAYSNARRLQYLQYPSGFELKYGYDTDGRVTTIGYETQPSPYGSYTNTTLTPLITAVTYLPFGPVSGYTWQGGQSVTRTFDKNYRLTDLVGTGLTLHFARDARGNINAEGATAGASPAAESYKYDPLNRLTELDNASGTAEQSYTYNPTGDRLSKTVAGTTQTYGYTTGTHQLTTVGSTTRTVDAVGNTTAMTSSTGAVIGLGYDNRNRLTTVTSSGSTIGSYQYNGLGDRVWRTITSPSAGTAATVYDPTGTGNLYGEYFGTDYREYVYLAGIPVAVSTDAGKAAPAISTLYADHLGTVRAVLNSAGTSTYTWPWLNNAFGEQPMSGSSAFYTRFPGQYFDEETGLFYNHNRFYDGMTDHELQSDPMGLDGGISTYAYAYGDPLNEVDPLGLRPPTPSEAAFLQSFFGKCFNAQQLDINKRLFGSRAWSPYDHHVNLPGADFEGSNGDNPVNTGNPYIASVLAHETLHTWQRDQGGNVTTSELGPQIASSLGGSDPYAYDQSVTDPAANLAQFQALFNSKSYEAQAQMWQDYVYSKLTGGDVSKWSQIASYVQSTSQCGCKK